MQSTALVTAPADNLTTAVRVLGGAGKQVHASAGQRALAMVGALSGTTTERTMPHIYASWVQHHHHHQQSAIISRSST